MFDSVRDFFKPKLGGAAVPIIQVSALPVAQITTPVWDGEKFFNGFGNTELLYADYWTLRARSVQLFEKNIYARGIIRRLVTNEINTGLSLEALPEGSILGLDDDALSEWSESVENRFHIYEDDPQLCDASEMLTFGGLQAAARMEALVAGDVLVVLRQDRRTGIPRVQLVSGAAVCTPLGGGPQPGNAICHGVEIDAQGRQVAYWINTKEGDPKRLPAYGEKSGRRLAWLVYGTDKRLDEVRGKPILSLVLQSLKEIDRYRDSVQNKATLNAQLAIYIKKTANVPGTRPITGGAVRRTTESAQGNDGLERSFNTAKLMPGLILDELAVGEEPHGFAPTGTDEKFGDFEEAIIQAVAWANEIPPEILRLSFSNNYSASQAAINEFKIYLNKLRTNFSEQFCRPIYIEWLISEVLNQKIEAPGFLDSWRSYDRYDEFGAWTASDWSGNIKPAVDMSRLVEGYKLLVDEGFISRSRAARELTGTKYSKNIQLLKTENEQLAEVAALLPANQPAQPAPSASGADDPPAAEGLLHVAS